MSQRMTLVVGSLMAVACLVASGMAWVAVRDSRQMNAAILTTLKQLAAPARVEPPPSMDWNPLKVHLVLGEKDGKPAQGFSVELKGHPIDSSTTMKLEETSGEDGIADFGLVRPGPYTLEMKTPWEESSSRQIIVRPGKEHVEEIVCPASEPEEAEIAFDVSGWPEVLRENNLWVVCSFYHTRQVTEQLWTLADSHRKVVITPTGELFDEVGIHRETPVRGFSVVGFDQLQWPSKRALKWPGRWHRLVRVSVVHEPDKSTLKEGKLPKVVAPAPRGPARRGFLIDRRSLFGDRKEQPTPLPTFEAKPGELNRWKIELSEELVSAVRKQLAEDEE